MNDYILTTTNLTKIFEMNFAVNNLNFAIKRGEIYGLVGKNGCGKTTLIRLLTGLYLPTKGSFQFHGIDGKKCSLAAIVETPSVYLSMTGYQNMLMQTKILNKNEDKINEILTIVDLLNVAKTNLKVKNYSLGMKQRLGLAITLLSEPEFLLLDEPMNGLDPIGIKQMRDCILKLKEKGMTILISSHILDELSRVATRYAFMEKGQIFHEISTKELLEKCSHSYEFILDTVENIHDVMQASNYKDYEVLPNNRLIVKSKIELTFFIQILSAAKINVLSFTEHSSTIEDYYLKMLGGERHV